MTGAVIAILSPGLTEITGAVIAMLWLGSLFPEMYSNRIENARLSDALNTVAKVSSGYFLISTGPNSLITS